MDGACLPRLSKLSVCLAKRAEKDPARYCYFSGQRATLTLIKITHSSRQNEAGLHGGAQIFNQGLLTQQLTFVECG
jgi:hypothetical protein